MQEALNNAWRHAECTAPTVTVAQVGDQLEVEVADDGTGFAIAEGEEPEAHLGLVGMRERAESLGGQFRVESAPGAGTRVIARLPLETTGGQHA